MIMLIEAVPVKKSVLWRKQEILVTNKALLGMKVMVISVPIPIKQRAWQRERLRRQVQALTAQLRVNTVCIKNDFPYPEWFEGYRKPDSREFLKRFLGKIAVISSQKHDTVFVNLHRADRISYSALFELCDSFRHILLSGQIGDITDSLFRKFGASVITSPTPERIFTADAAVLFSEPDEMPCFNTDCAIIRPDDSLEVEVIDQNGHKLDIPDGYSKNVLISEAILRGSISIDDIRIVKY